MKTIGEFIEKFDVEKIKYRLDIGEPRYRLKDLQLSKWKSKLTKLQMKYSNKYGDCELREIVVRKIGALNDNISTKNVLICNGATGGIYYSLKALIEQGERVTVFSPCWPNYYNIIQECLGVAIEEKIDLKAHVWEIDVDSIIEKKPAVILIDIPNNPTGRTPDIKNIEYLIKKCVENKIYLIADLTYYELIYSSSNQFAQMKLNDYIIYVYSFSKFYCMPGLRIGYIVSSENTIDKVCRIQHNSINSVGLIEQEIAKECIQSQKKIFVQLKKEYKKQINNAVLKLNKVSGISCIDPQGGFFLFIRLEGIEINEFINRLAEKYSTLVLPGTIFNNSFTEYIRVSCVNPQVFEKGIDNILNLLNEEEKSEKINCSSIKG